MRVILIPWLRAAAGPALLGLAAFSCSFRGEDSRRCPPILVIGVDGLEWSVLEPLMAQGRLPNFQNLAERGVAGSLQTFLPTFSPVLWTTVATGLPPQRHGILHFAQATPSGEMGLPYTSNCRAAPAIWNVAGQQGRSVLAVAWWVSWPAEQVPNGRIVASYAAQVQGRILWKPGVWAEGLPELTWPPALQEKIMPALIQGAPDGPLRREFEETFGTVPGTADWQFPRERDALFRTSYHGDRTHLQIMIEQLHQEVADLNMIYIGLPDVAGHFFWRYREPEVYQYPVPQDHVTRLGDRIDRCYEVVDLWLGQLLEAVPVDTRVLLLSDHGMHAANPADPSHPQSGAHEDGPDGVVFLAGAGVERRGILPVGERRLGSMYDPYPTLLEWLQLAVPEHLPGKPLRALMTEEWRSQNPPTGTAETYAEGFRAPTAPRVPRAGLDDEFNEGIMNQLGYAEAKD